MMHLGVHDDAVSKSNHPGAPFLHPTPFSIAV